MSPAERELVLMPRMRVARAEPGELLARLSRRTGNSWDLNYLGVYNALFRNHSFGRGELVNVARFTRF